MRKSSQHRGVKRGVLYAVAVAVAVCGLLAVEGGGTTVVRAATSTEKGVVGTASHDATIAAPAARLSRAHRLTPVSAFLATAIGATIVAYGLSRTRRRISTRRGEQFFVRRRGPPLHPVTM